MRQGAALDPDEPVALVDRGFTADRGGGGVVVAAGVAVKEAQRQEVGTLGRPGEEGAGHEDRREGDQRDVVLLHVPYVLSGTITAKRARIPRRPRGRATAPARRDDLPALPPLVRPGRDLLRGGRGAPRRRATPGIRARAELAGHRETGAILSGRYQIRGLIGRGGLARVYLAVDTTTGAAEVGRVKISSSAIWSQEPKVGARSVPARGRRIAARIGHPNIARILGAGEQPDRAPFIVLEYLTGESVGDLLHREGRMSEDFALALAKRAAAALVAAHAEGVIHRDIKPDNLFLVDDGSVLKVLDFGMAKLQEGAFTAVGTAIGTVPYMAPEQSMADRVDGRTDVYGLGITLFKMITGTLPFDTEDDATLVAHHLYTPMPRPSARLPGLDPRIERVILAATRKLPDNRYPSNCASCSRDVRADPRAERLRRDRRAGAPDRARHCTSRGRTPGISKQAPRGTSAR